MTDEQAIIGEADVSRAASVRRAINKLIKNSNTSDFDLAELFLETDSKLYWQGWGFDSFSKFAKSLEIKYTKCFYLLAIQKTMNAAGLERKQFEPIGKTKLRMISQLSRSLDSEYNGTPMKLLVRELTLKAGDLTPDEVQSEVDVLLGKSGEESMVWVNLHVKKLAKENVITPALRKAKRFMGQQKDETTGEFKDASDGSAIEMICANFLTDPNYDTPEDGVTDAAETVPENNSNATPGEVELPPQPEPETSKYSID